MVVYKYLLYVYWLDIKISRFYSYQYHHIFFRSKFGADKPDELTSKEGSRVCCGPPWPVNIRYWHRNYWNNSSDDTIGSFWTFSYRSYEGNKNMKSVDQKPGTEGRWWWCLGACYKSFTSMMLIYDAHLIHIYIFSSQVKVNIRYWVL